MASSIEGISAGTIFAAQKAMNSPANEHRGAVKAVIRTLLKSGEVVLKRDVEELADIANEYMQANILKALNPGSMNEANRFQIAYKALRKALSRFNQNKEG